MALSHMHVPQSVSAARSEAPLLCGQGNSYQPVFESPGQLSAAWHQYPASWRSLELPATRKPLSLPRMLKLHGDFTQI